MQRKHDQSPKPDSVLPRPKATTRPASCFTMAQGMGYHGFTNQNPSIISGLIEVFPIFIVPSVKTVKSADLNLILPSDPTSRLP